MSSSESTSPNESEPTWEVVHLFPLQGQWTESAFFELHSNRMIELADGRLEVLPMPNWLHQLMVKFMMRALELAASGKGEVLDAPLPVRLFPRTIREPDVMYFAPGSVPDDPRGYPTKIDLAIEVVSEGVEARRRDYDDKRRDYAKASVPEYWIVDPDEKKIVVFVLEDDSYQTHGEFRPGEIARGILLDNFQVDVAELMKLGDKK